MSLSSINTNIAAYSAQRNIGAASDSASSSIARLSSGNRIVKASDDVAGLATGTSLRTSVTTLKQALLNTSQGSSLLQIADGALGQVVDILNRQKAIAVQAGSGSLSSTDRAFLNQEFQALKDEIDRIATQTKFSSVNLLNGNLSGAQAISTNVSNVAPAAAVSAGNVLTVAGVTNNQTITVNGVTITFTSSALGTADAAGKVRIGAAAADTAANLAAFLNQSTDARLANVNFTANAANLTANWSGGTLTAAYVLDVTAGTAGANVTVGTAANRTIAVVAGADGLGRDRVRTLGATSGTILVNGDTAATNTGSALDLSTVIQNQDFIGKFGQGRVGLMQATFTAAGNAIMSVKVGDITYTAGATGLVNAGATNFTFTGRDINGTAAGGTFVLRIAGGGITAAMSANQAAIDSTFAQINQQLQSLDIVQNRDFTNFQNGAVQTVAGVQVGTLVGATANFRSNNFTAAQLEDITITSPAVGSTDAIITARINGQNYTSYSGIGNQIATNTAITLTNTSDPTKSFTIVTGGTAIAGSTTTALNLSNQANADAIRDALKSAFGITAGSAALQFQVGNTSKESLGVRIDSVETKNIYGGATIDVTTQANAGTASTTVDAAINRVMTIRANVGALQSRFDFTANVLEVNVQNQDAARGVLLDTDVTAESTAYATAQVQLQAGIAVLAQANLLPQNLLKLIG